MDNKITKKRLYDLLSYEWIMILVVIVLAIFAGELIYTVASVRLSTGQQFKYYYDLNVDSTDNPNFFSMLERNNVFSYDVLDVSYETIGDQMDVLSIRLSVQEGDIIFTNKVEPAKDSGDKHIRAKSRIDTYDCNMISMEELLSDAKSYLKENFLIDSEKNKENPDDVNYGKESIDDEKVRLIFNERMRKDNRFRKQSEKEEGYQLEKKRIEKLCQDVVDFDKVMKTAPDELFYRYTKFSQSYELADKEDLKAQFKEAVDNEKAEGRENLAYGLNMEALKGGKTDPSSYFRISEGDGTAKDVVLMVFGFKEFQPHLQYESLSFINAIIRECSNLLD